MTTRRRRLASLCGDDPQTARATRSPFDAADFYRPGANHPAMQLDEHAEALASDLGVDKEEVKSDLEN
ncbi:MAG: hypothetical protein ABEJ22_09575, partial [Haloferacaceae archaeon]